MRVAVGRKLIGGLIPLFIFMSAINPLLNSNGDTVLFTYFGDRPYTFEALCYGMALSAMFISVIIWFASNNQVMTSDKFLYMFGRMIPSVSMILTMVLRLVPMYQKKAVQISSARKSVGMSADMGTRREKAHNGMTIVSALTSWALEGGITMADSMKSRGYGCGRRTSISINRFDTRDILLKIVMVILAVTVIICCAKGGAEAAYTPEMYISPLNDIYSATGAAAYCLFLSVPAVLNIIEELTWRILRSRI